MKLLLPEILHTLRHKPILVVGLDGMPELSQPSDKGRVMRLRPLLPRIHNAQKYIFDSGQDVDEKTVTAVRKTAVEMVAAGLLHLPHPEIWVEDPFEGRPDEQRHLYFCAEKADHIEVTHFQRMPLDLIAAVAHRRNVPNLMWMPFAVCIPLDMATDEVFLPDYPGRVATRTISHLAGEVAYSVKKLLVTLATTNHGLQRVPLPRKGVWNGDPRTRPYAHTVISIPDDDPPHPSEGGTGRGAPGVRRRRHLVSGYNRYKNTRPMSEWKWIAPYWRGSLEVEIIERDHYEIH